jgi:hypothetical protein
MPRLEHQDIPYEELTLIISAQEFLPERTNGLDVENVISDQVSFVHQVFGPVP